MAVTFFVLALGPFVGSFVGVLVDRLPLGRDVVVDPSACGSCGTRLRWRDLIPVLSFALARGRCRHCGAPIAPHLLYLEILAAGLGLLAVLAGGAPAYVLLTAVMLWLLLALAACDLAMFRLPDVLTAALAGVVLLRAPDLGAALWGGAAGMAAFFALRHVYARARGREGLGLGDVKLMAGLGALTGVALLPHLVLGAALLALAGALVMHRSPQRLSGRTPLPFGTALCASAAGLWLWGVV
ncbi:A24 family peptidase [uncultured Tateyamaria sp.]|uniref:prepilin peptidase n=1 Tax=Tateyamaria sp. 1078 TaxID=3417464 RepID=UPI00262FC7BC|nr:A24 family peptidase [uncultured Tateyamaria sp.]